MIAAANPNASTSSTPEKGSPISNHQDSSPGTGLISAATSHPDASQPVMSSAKRGANRVSGIKKV